MSDRSHSEAIFWLWARYALLVVSACTLAAASWMAIDYFWMRGAFCTDAILRKEHGNWDECENVRHRIENIQDSPILICRCR